MTMENNKVMQKALPSLLGSNIKFPLMYLDGEWQKQMFVGSGG